MSHITYRERLIEASDSNYQHRLKSLPYLRYAKGIEEVCLHKPFPAPYPVPAHQEKLTQQRWDEQDIKASIGLSDQMMDHYFVGINRQYMPVDQSVFERLREFTLDRKIVFAWPKSTNNPTIADSPFGDDLLPLSVETISAKGYLTIQRGKHRRPKDNSHFSFRGVIRSIIDEDIVDQDLREVKELPQNN